MINHDQPTLKISESKFYIELINISQLHIAISVSDISCQSLDWWMNFLQRTKTQQWTFWCRMAVADAFGVALSHFIFWAVEPFAPSPTSPFYGLFSVIEKMVCFLLGLPGNTWDMLIVFWLIIACRKLSLGGCHSCHCSWPFWLVWLPLPCFSTSVGTHLNPLVNCGGSSALVPLSL